MATKPVSNPKEERKHNRKDEMELDAPVPTHTNTQPSTPSSKTQPKAENTTKSRRKTSSKTATQSQQIAPVLSLREIAKPKKLFFQTPTHRKTIKQGESYQNFFVSSTDVDACTWRELLEKIFKLENRPGSISIEGATFEKLTYAPISIDTKVDGQTFTLINTRSYHLSLKLSAKPSQEEDSDNMDVEQSKTSTATKQNQPAAKGETPIQPQQGQHPQPSYFTSGAALQEYLQQHTEEQRQELLREWGWDFCVIIFLALEEEFQVLRDIFEKRFQWKFDGDAIVCNCVIYKFKVNHRLCGVTFANDMGHAPMTSLVDRVLSGPRPKYAINFGISGTMDAKEYPIGDVLIAHSVTSWLDKSNITHVGKPQLDPETHLILTIPMTIKLNGETDQTTPLSGVEQLQQRQTQLLTSFQEAAKSDDCIAYLHSRCGKILNHRILDSKQQLEARNPPPSAADLAQVEQNVKQEFDINVRTLTSRPPDVHTGGNVHVMSGDAVAKAEGIGETFRGTRHGKLSAVDMESGAMCLAINKFTDLHTSKIVIRVISDEPGKKNEIDKKYSGANRTWALCNGSHWLGNVLIEITK